MLPVCELHETNSKGPALKGSKNNPILDDIISNLFAELGIIATVFGIIATVLGIMVTVLGIIVTNLICLRNKWQTWNKW